jgi:hypothetical protein
MLRPNSVQVRGFVRPGFWDCGVCGAHTHDSSEHCTVCGVLRFASNRLQHHLIANMGCRNLRQFDEIESLGAAVVNAKRGDAA